MTHRGLVLATALVWSAAAWALAALGPPAAKMVAEVGIVVPLESQVAFGASAALRAGWGAVPLLLLVAVLVSPARLAPDAAGVRPWLWLALLQGVVVGVTACFALLMWPALHVPMCLHDRAEPGPPWFLVPALGVGLLQVHAWWRVSATIRNDPRGTPGLEVGRVAFLASVPAALAASIVALALHTLGATGPATLLVPVPLAGAGTVALAACGAAVALRARSA